MWHVEGSPQQKQNVQSSQPAVGWNITIPKLKHPIILFYSLSSIVIKDNTLHTITLYGCGISGVDPFTYATAAHMTVFQIVLIVYNFTFA